MLRTVRVAAFAGLILVAGLSVSAAQPASTAADCGTSEACRDRALEAADRQEFEIFHDLAWRAVQKGPPRDIDLLYLLARAQSLSGRPDDSLVMLHRILTFGPVPRDVLTSDDFRRVRARPGWSAVEALLTGAPAPETSVAATPPPPVVPEATTKTRRPNLPKAGTAPAVTPNAAAASTLLPAPQPVRHAEEALRFSSAGVVPSGVAFDGVSGRFLFGIREARKIVVVGEHANTMVDLVRADSAEFYDIEALEIDARRGDLWVATSEQSRDGPAGGSGEGDAAIHRLQLVSGRPIATVRVPPTLRPVAFSDLAVTNSGTVMALDRAGQRVWRLPAAGRSLEVVAQLRLENPTSLTLAGADRHAYVAHADGIAYVDLSTKAVTRVRAGRNIDLRGIERLRWHAGSLVAVKRRSAGLARVVRLKLAANGTSIVAEDVLDSSMPAGRTPPAVSLSGEDFYYVTSVETDRPDGRQEASADDGNLIVRRARIR